MAEPKTEGPSAEAGAGAASGEQVPGAAAESSSSSSSSSAAAAASSSSSSAAEAPTELSQQPRATESLRPGGGALRPQRFGKDDKSKSGSGGAAATGTRPGSSSGSTTRRSFGAAGKGLSEPKPKPQPSAAAPEDDAEEETPAEKEPEKAAPKTEADAKTADGQHRLQSQWTFWFDKPQGNARRVKGTSATTEVYESSLREVGTFDTVEGFWRHFNFMRKPSDLDVGANYHLFKAGIKPMWEDKANANGGKWQIRVKDRHSLDEYWQNLVLALVGEMADDGDEVCGIVMSRRRGGDRLAVWTRRKDDNVKMLGGALKQLMLDESSKKAGATGAVLEFSFHESSLKSGSSYGTDVVYTV